MFKRIRGIKPPTDDRLAAVTTGSFFRDAIEIQPQNPLQCPAQVQYAIFGQMPSWVNSLMDVRNKMVKYLGFDVGRFNEKPAKAVTEIAVGDQLGFMTVAEKTADEMICHAEDRHMDFYLSTKLREEKVILSTLVNKKTFIGKCYVNLIVPFHYVIARAVIYHALKKRRL